MASRPTRQRVALRELGVRRCESQKVGYQTNAAALDVAELLMAEGRVRPGCHITPYECDRCRQWHVGNKVIVPVGRRKRWIAQRESS